jgi:hypothetical protein
VGYPTVYPRTNSPSPTPGRVVKPPHVRDPHGPSMCRARPPSRAPLTRRRPLRLTPTPAPLTAPSHGKSRHLRGPRGVGQTSGCPVPIYVATSSQESGPSGRTPNAPVQRGVHVTEMTDPRPYSAHFVHPGEGVNGSDRYLEPVSSKLLWLILEGMANIPARGRALFPGGVPQQNKLWLEFRSFVRQARAYWDAGQSTQGSSASLLYYYCFLNLAKAELLTTLPDLVIGKRIVHGLSFSPTRAQSIRGDTLKVGTGAFSYLYEKRTGLTLPPGTFLSIPRLFSMLREVGLEVSLAGMGTTVTKSAYQAVVSDQTSSWPLVLFLGDGPALNSRGSMESVFRKNFELVDYSKLSAPWRDTFALSRRLVPGGGIQVFQSRLPFSVTSEGRSFPDSRGAARFVRSAMHPYVGDSVQEDVEFVLSPSLLKSRALPMPVDLARYALIYYASSLVRYKPAALDPVRQASQAWLFDSFCRETPIFLLSNSVAGIENRPQYFESAGFRT